MSDKAALARRIQWARVLKGRGSEEEAGPWSDIGAMTIWFGSIGGWEEAIRPKRRKVRRRGACIVEEYGRFWFTNSRMAEMA